VRKARERASVNANRWSFQVRLAEEMESDMTAEFFAPSSRSNFVVGRVVAQVAALLAIAFVVPSSRAATYTGTGPEAKLGQALAAQLTRYEKASAEANPDDLIENFYSADAVFVTTGDGAVMGMSEIRPLMKKLLAKPASVKVEIIKVIALSPTSALTLLMQNVNGKDVKSVWVWRREKGVWKVVNDTYFSGKY
jgi:hypothetical protein